MTVIILVVIMMVGILLRALSFVIVGFFVGELLPRSVAAWSTRGPTACPGPCAENAWRRRQ